MTAAAAARLVVTFLPRSKRLLISWLQSPSAVIVEPKKIKSDTASTVSPSISHEVMGPERNYIQSAKTRWGADCGSDHELLIAKFRLKLKEIDKTTRPFRYDQNQIPYNYTVEVRNSFKRLDLIDTVPEELWTEAHDIVQEAMIKTFPKEKKMQKGKMVV